MQKDVPAVLLLAIYALPVQIIWNSIPKENVLLHNITSALFTVSIPHCAKVVNLLIDLKMVYALKI